LKSSVWQVVAIVGVENADAQDGADQGLTRVSPRAMQSVISVGISDQIHARFTIP